MVGTLRPLGAERWGLWILLAPTLVGLLIGSVGSILFSLGISFTTWDNINPAVWIGLKNYTDSLTNPKFLQSVINTFKFSAIYVPLCVIASLALAVLLNQCIRGKDFFRAMFFLPSITSAVAVGLVFSWIFARDSGALNQILSLAGISPVSWLGDDMILYSVTIANVWGALGEGMIIFLAALQAVPANYAESASLDGAGRGRTFISITLPAISPAIFFQTLMSTINGLQAFAYIYMLTKKSSGESIMATMVYQIYRNGFRWFSMGMASAQAIILSLMIIFLMLVYFRGEKKWVSYD